MKCTSLITRGTPCNKEALEGKERCKRHQAAFEKKEAKAGPIREGGCHGIKADGKRCDIFALEGSMLCRKHTALLDATRRAAERKVQEDAEIAERSKVLIRDAVPWRIALQMVLHEWRQNTLGPRVFWQTALRVAKHQGATAEEIDAYYDGIRFMIPLPYQGGRERGLADLAKDPQNIHTAEVSSQTEKMTQLLLSEPIPPEQKTLKILFMKCMKLCKITTMKKFLMTMDDINSWYEKAWCIKENDFLYKRLLDASVAKIETSEHKIALYKRIYEEAVESLGMCCQGHLSRLLNVFVGFDDAFKSPISAREALQDEMATLSTMDMSPDEMVVVAKTILQRLAIPTEEWSQWTQAFVE